MAFGVVRVCDDGRALFELADPMNAISSGDAPPAWTESNILEVDGCNDDADFLEVVDLELLVAAASSCGDDPRSDDCAEEDDSPPRMPHKCRESRNEFCGICLSGGTLVAAAAVNTDAADRMTKEDERIALRSFAIICVLWFVSAARSPRSCRPIAVLN